MLRNDLGLIGTRFGCGLEQCGCCMVLIDGKPEKSCGKRAVGPSPASRSSRSRGWARREHPHPLQQAFLDEQAGQCGYCLAGILISAKALLDQQPVAVARARSPLALDDNICRCGTHSRILRAVESAAAQMREGAAR